MTDEELIRAIAIGSVLANQSSLQTGLKPTDDYESMAQSTEAVQSLFYKAVERYETIIGSALKEAPRK